MNKLLKISLLGLVLAQLHGCATERRTVGTYVGDQEVELKAMDRLSSAFPQKNVSISATSYSLQVLLTGQAPDEAIRTRATEVVKDIPGVRRVFNEIAVSGVTSLTSDSNDASITTKVIARMLQEDNIPSTQIKVVTEAGVVYLMGLVTQAEGKAAAAIASNTGGVTKVVKLFEYIN
jgi:osmotically-inducible protein OsmY